MTLIPPETPIAIAWEGATPKLMARITGNDGANITQSDITSIARTIYDLDSATPDTAIGDATAPVVADVVFDTLQTDDLWDEDTTGYNFKDEVLGSLLTEPHRYMVKWIFTAAVGQPFPHLHEIHNYNVPGR